MSFQVPQNKQPDGEVAIPQINRDDQSRIPTYKICLIGDGGTGKTTYINRVLNGDYIPNYIATHGAVTRYVTLPLSNGSIIRYEVWDTAGQEKNAGLRDGYFINAVSAFFFFDVNSRETISNVSKHIEDFLRVCLVPNPKIFILANKIDIKGKEIDLSRVRVKIPSRCTCEIIQVSAKTGHRFAEPFVKLTRHLLNDDTIEVSMNRERAEAFFQPSPIDADKFIAYVMQQQSVSMPSADVAPEEE